MTDDNSPVASSPAGPGDDEHRAAGPQRARRLGRPMALVAAGVLAGGITTATMSASAQTSPTPAPSSTSAPADPDGSKPRGEGKGGPGCPDGARGRNGQNDSTVAPTAA